MKLSTESQGSGVSKAHPVSQNKSKHVKLFFSVLGAVAGLGVSVVICAMLYQRLVLDVRQEQLQMLSRQYANAGAVVLGSQFDSLANTLADYAAKTSVVNAIAKDDIAAKAKLSQSMKRQFPEFVAVSFFKRGEAQLDSAAFPPLRFSELALINAAEKGEPQQVQAAKIGDRWLLHLVAPVTNKNSGAVVGVLWLSTGLTQLESLLSEKANLGQLRLYQNFGKNNRILIAQAGLGDLDTVELAKIGSGTWELEFQAGQPLLAQTHSNSTLFFLICGALSVVLVLLFSFLGGKLVVLKKNKHEELEPPQKIKGSSVSTDYVDPMYQSGGILDMEINEGDAGLLGLDEDEPQAPPHAGEFVSPSDTQSEPEEDDEGEAAAMYPSEIFRAYDIRGIVGEQITKEFALALGKALGSETLDNRETTLAVARDARTHSPELTEWLIRGVLSTGCNVLNIGTVPTPLLYFLLETTEEVSSGVVVTASHNDARFNGFKIVMKGVTRAEADIRELRSRMIKARFATGAGKEQHHDIIPKYIDTIFSDVALAGEMHVVIDAGNAVPGLVAPKLFEELGCRVTPLYCDLDGRFPNHVPDTSVAKNLQDLIAKVQEQGADIGIALDGDGDRITAVSPSGKIYYADRLLMLFAKDIISRSPGADVIFDVKSTRHLNSCITHYGGRPIMWKTGHSHMKQKMQETHAVVGAEYSGHIFIKDRWFGFDDGMYAAARLLEVLSLQAENLDEAMAEFPESLTTPEIRIPIDDHEKFKLIELLRDQGDFGEGRLTLIDGIRADFGFGWGLVRASNTGPELTMRFEADNEEALHKLKGLFVRELKKVRPSIDINWKQ